MKNFTHIDISDEDLTDDPDFKEDIKRYEGLNLKYKKFSCLAILRNSLEKGNEKIRKTIKTSLLDKADTFDKILISIVNNCIGKINQKQIDKVNIK